MEMIKNLAASMVFGTLFVMGSALGIFAGSMAICGASLGILLYVGG